MTCGEKLWVFEQVRTINKLHYRTSDATQVEAGEYITCQRVVIATGTFLGGQINIGLKSTPFGRIK